MLFGEEVYCVLYCLINESTLNTALLSFETQENVENSCPTESSSNTPSPTDSFFDTDDESNTVMTPSPTPTTVDTPFPTPAVDGDDIVAGGINDDESLMDDDTDDEPHDTDDRSDDVDGKNDDVSIYPADDGILDDNYNSHHDQSSSKSGKKDPTHAGKTHKFFHDSKSGKTSGGKKASGKGTKEGGGDDYGYYESAAVEGYPRRVQFFESTENVR